MVKQTRNTDQYSESEEFFDANQAIQRLKDIYQNSIALIKESFAQLIAGDLTATQPVEACYPHISINIGPEKLDATDVTLSYGIVDAPGLYGTTITKPSLFEDYLKEQITLLLKNYGGPILIRRSRRRIPWHFAGLESPDSQFTPEQLKQFRLGFIHPDLKRIDDEVVNHTFEVRERGEFPLALFDAERVDYSLYRLYHYTGTNPKHFQNFIVLTNYQRYMEAFYNYSQEQLVDGIYSSLIEPGDVVKTAGKNKEISTSGQPPKHLPQMPTYHLKRSDKNGISFINIGIGPTNAKNITDHLAVLRPHCWIILGHCAGLQRSQILGDYILAHGYVREDGVLDQDLPLWVPVPPIAEVQVALQEAVAQITGLQPHQLKTRMRTGTVVTTCNRNWELRSRELHERFNQSRAIALDMESATTSANGLRFRVPYGTLLCVSDKPVHGEIKLRNMANAFYESRVDQHLKIGLKAVDILRERGTTTLHSRKLRGFNEPPFR